MPNIKNFNPIKSMKNIFNSTKQARFSDLLTLALMIFATFALFSLLYFYVRPIKTVDIKVPVATDQSAYSPGDQISGIFFGEVFYEGRVKVLREIFCSNYKAVIDPPVLAADGDFFNTISVPRTLEGTTAPIGHLPESVPVGANCVLRFTNIYEISTPFGMRRLEAKYYTQNFAIISDKRSNALDCEAAGGNDCTNDDTVKVENQTQNNTPTQNPTQTQNPPQQVQPNQTTNNNTTNNNTTTPPAEIPETCTVNLLGIKIGCN